MEDKRIVMEITVEFVSNIPNALLERVFRAFDEDRTKPSPIEYVSSALTVAGHRDWSIPDDLLPLVEGGTFEVRVTGPDIWSAAFDAEQSASEQRQQGVAGRRPDGGDARGHTE